MEPTCGPPQATDGEDRSLLTGSPQQRAQHLASRGGFGSISVGVPAQRHPNDATFVAPAELRHERSHAPTPHHGAHELWFTRLSRPEVSRRTQPGTSEVTLQCPVTGPTNCRSRDMVRPVSNMYDLTMTSIEGEPVALDQFRDQVCLIVNVASN